MNLDQTKPISTNDAQTKDAEAPRQQKKQPSILTLFWIVSWAITLGGGLYIKLFEPSDSVAALGLIPFGLAAIGSTPLVLIRCGWSLYKRRKLSTVKPE
ncbi:MAG: hypothetical protein NTX11_02375 [Candidatus Saccharibacteria bacterium]|nr:hypothetical protein [Candidatus Saccharibacteria bacterium]